MNNKNDTWIHCLLGVLNILQIALNGSFSDIGAYLQFRCWSSRNYLEMIKLLC